MTSRTPTTGSRSGSEVTHELRTERLLLRRWRQSDRSPFAELNADDAVMEHFPGVLSREESDAVANTRSIRVMERLGMTHHPADDFDHPRLPEGHRIRRDVLYRTGRPAWERR